MKRKIAIAAGILVTAVSTISGSYAYYQDSVTVTNHISTGDVNIGIQEYEKDGDTEKVYAGPADGIVLPSQSMSLMKSTWKKLLECQMKRLKMESNSLWLLCSNAVKHGVLKVN